MGKGGELRCNSRLQKILLGSGGAVEGFQMADGSTVTGDLYVSAMPGMCPSHPMQHRCVSPSCTAFRVLQRLPQLEAVKGDWHRGLLGGSTSTLALRMPCGMQPSPMCALCSGPAEEAPASLLGADALLQQDVPAQGRPGHQHPHVRLISALPAAQCRSDQTLSCLQGNPAAAVEV